MFLKRIKLTSKLISSILVSGILISSPFLVVSCGKSSSKEDEGTKLMKDEKNINVKLNLLENNVENITNIKDVFISNNTNLFEIDAPKIDEFNNSLGDPKSPLRINIEIKSFVFPKITEENKNIDFIEIIIEVSGLGNNYFYRKKLDLPNEINKEIITNGDNNYFGFENNNEPNENKLYSKFKINTLIRYIQNNHKINEGDNENTIKNTLTFKFEEDIDYFIEQSNLYCLFDSDNGDNVNLIIFTSDKNIEDEDLKKLNVNNIKQGNYLSMKFIVPKSEIISSQEGNR